MGIGDQDFAIVAGAQENGVPAWRNETVQGSAAEAAVEISGPVLKRQFFSLLHEGGQAAGATGIVQQHFDAVHVVRIEKFLLRFAYPAGDGEGKVPVFDSLQNEGWRVLLPGRVQRGERNLLRPANEVEHQQCRDSAGTKAESEKPEPAQPPMRIQKFLHGAKLR